MNQGHGSDHRRGAKTCLWQRRTRWESLGNTCLLRLSETSHRMHFSPRLPDLRIRLPGHSFRGSFKQFNASRESLGNACLLRLNSPTSCRSVDPRLPDLRIRLAGKKHRRLKELRIYSASWAAPAGGDPHMRTRTAVCDAS
ncbi:hypothetical protein RRG08_051178 [Elysia crispata]|uniref:Uncharacterized protein n=1 Tax=Elysia crispata TaxID=231223 RepID=A0AAE0Z7E1_9GAST|nr:hypothetical protein RRG08_051178 [Elysia crispata]